MKLRYCIFNTQYFQYKNCVWQESVSWRLRAEPLVDFHGQKISRFRDCLPELRRPNTTPIGAASVDELHWRYVEQRESTAQAALPVQDYAVHRHGHSLQAHAKVDNVDYTALPGLT